MHKTDEGGFRDGGSCNGVNCSRGGIREENPFHQWAEIGSYYTWDYRDFHVYDQYRQIHQRRSSASADIGGVSAWGHRHADLYFSNIQMEYPCYQQPSHCPVCSGRLHYHKGNHWTVQPAMWLSNNLCLSVRETEAEEKLCCMFLI